MALEFPALGLTEAHHVAASLSLFGQESRLAG